jgi:hypothetical protein
MGTLRLRIVGRNRKKILAERTTDTPLFTSKSIKSKILSKRSTPEKSAKPKEKGREELSQKIAGENHPNIILFRLIFRRSGTILPEGIH